MKIIFKLIIITIILTNSFNSIGQNSGDSLFLWPDGAPGSIDFELNEIHQVNGILRVRQVSQPTIQLFLPEKEKATGAAVVICPGGGYGILAIDHEGFQIAKWLNSFGVAGIVLKYRLPDDRIMEDKTIGPLMDAQQAIRMVRQNADKWNIDPEKVGIMGFSAGGHLAATAGTHFNDIVGGITDKTSVRPDFNILIYPVVSFKEGVGHMGSRRNLIGQTNDFNLVSKYSNELHITEATPPTFLVHSRDDKAVPVQNSIRFYEALLKYDTPSEMHLYNKGGHGYGLGREGTTTLSWPDRCAAWLKEIGMAE
ncbi:alpha/beta hydrolase [Flexithrix dorotheae]|uniref:alpha/beta hydrolase n=1 Tax=Flexithrix dorotheae TaxID=70993 RepID=UPI00037482F5|nr:alpha/beta hydrolase [Flexithrix dorotheae]